jgi:hypothetical protein
MKLLIRQYSPVSRHFQIFSSASCSQTPSVRVLPSRERPSFTPIQNNGKALKIVVGNLDERRRPVALKRISEKYGAGVWTGLA